MSIRFDIPQAFFAPTADGFSRVNSSPGFPEANIDVILAAIGPIPTDFAPGRAIAVLPTDDDHRAIMEVRLNPVKYRVMIVDSSLYHHLPDPFLFVDRFPVNWEASRLDDLTWSQDEGPKRRLVEELNLILKDGNGPLLLGTTQALVFTERVFFVSPEPMEKLLREVWALLPESTRRFTPATTYCFAAEPIFHFAAMPELPKENRFPFLDEERILDYPETPYEKNLQIAIEMGDQRELDRLLNRRSTSDTIRLMLIIIAILFGAALAGKLVSML